MSADPIIDMLRASMEEELPIKIYINGHALEGTVIELDMVGSVHLINKAERIVLYTQKIDAVKIKHRRTAQAE